MDTDKSYFNLEEKLAKNKSFKLMNIKALVLEYVNAAIVYKSGFMVFKVRSYEEPLFQFFYSSNYELHNEIPDSTEEGEHDILFTLDCKILHDIPKIGDEIEIIVDRIAFDVFTQIELYWLFDKYGLEDSTDQFLKERYEKNQKI